MKTRYLNTKWFVPLLGIAVAVGGFRAATTYLDLQRKAQSEEAFAATLDRLYADHRISRALKTLQDGDVGATARGLDLLLCQHILLVNAQLPSASDQQRAYAQDAFVRLARLRPHNPETPAGAGMEISYDRVKAERVLEQVCLAAAPATEGWAVSH